MKTIYPGSAKTRSLSVDALIFGSPGIAPSISATSRFSRASRTHWDRRRSDDDATHRYCLGVPTPFPLGASALPAAVNGDDNAVHIVVPHRRAAAFARDYYSRTDPLRQYHCKRTVINLALPFFLCAARQNGLDHRRRSGITRS